MHAACCCGELTVPATPCRCRSSIAMVLIFTLQSGYLELFAENVAFRTIKE